MYVRPRAEGEGEGIRIPDNYSGNAFHGDSLTPAPPVEPITEDTAPTEQGGPDEPPRAVPEVLPEKEIKEHVPVMKKSSPFSSLLPPKIPGTREGLLGDVGIEELVIIGILILLSQSETDDDILLLLVLLLFYK